MRDIKKHQLDQKGMVSIIVTMVLIILMTLVVLAMSQNANREQRQALDRQLSDQAFYNAESGINDWANYLYNNPNASVTKDDCDPKQSGFSNPPDNQIDGPDGVNSYTCITYDKAPRGVVFDNIAESDSVVVPIEAYGGSGSNYLKYITISWKAAEGESVTNGCSLTANSELPRSLGSNCNVGGLRVDLVSPNGTRDQIINNNFAAFLLPNRSNSGGSIDYASARGSTNQGAIGQADCSTDNTCRINITNVGLHSNDKLYLHMKSIYGSTDVTVNGCHANSNPCNDNQLIRFSGAQILLDSTGKANDVLRRIQVRIPASNQYDNSGSFALRTTQSICKLIDVDGSAPDPSATFDTACNN